MTHIGIRWGIKILFFVISPTCLEGCCDGHHLNNTPDVTRSSVYRYRVVAGEAFVVQCPPDSQNNKDVVWSRIRYDGRTEDREEICRNKVLNISPTETEHSGNYSCQTGGKELFVQLQVLEKDSLVCTEPKESTVTLVVDAAEDIPCPNFSCGDHTLNTTWYKVSHNEKNICTYTRVNIIKNSEAVARLWRNKAFCVEKSILHVCSVTNKESGIYFCDRQTKERGLIWTNRRAVNVTVIPMDTNNPPEIIKPSDNTTEDVEIGKPYTLTCKVRFGFERLFTGQVQWYSNNLSNTEDMTPKLIQSQENEKALVIQKAQIEEVTLQHFNFSYTCVASNAIGNNSVTITLTRKPKEIWREIIVYLFVLLVLVVGLGIIVQAKWLELFLLYRLHCPYVKNTKDEKEFDVFVSYVWLPVAEEVGEGTLEQSMPYPQYDEEESCQRMDFLCDEARCGSERPLEVELTRVLEQQWGCRLYLLERDVLPGGVYTEDVVSALQRSRMLICLLCDAYLTDSNSVFVLEMGIQFLLCDPSFKLLLIWTRDRPSSLAQLDPPLPPLVHKALRVLPSLDWGSAEPGSANANFWMSVKSAVPVQSSALVSLHSHI